MEVISSAAATLPIQPAPIDAKISTLNFPHGYVATCVERVWAIGDTRRCRLCPSCAANHERGTCTVHVDQTVSPDSAALFSTRGLTPFERDGLGYGNTRADRA